MTAFNVVRFRVKPGNEQRFIDEHSERFSQGGNREMVATHQGRRDQGGVAPCRLLDRR